MTKVGLPRIVFGRAIPVHYNRSRHIPTLWGRERVYRLRAVPGHCHRVRGLYVAIPRYVARPAWAMAHTAGCLVVRP